MANIPYVDVAEAQQYFDDRLNSEAWDEATDIDKLKALKTATNRINNLRFIGQKLNISQINAFPRLGQISVPTAIKEATCELALQLLDMVDPNLEIDNLATTSESYVTARASYNRDFVLAHIKAGIPSAEAWAKLLPYLCDPLAIRIMK
jgi:hypothetical protein